MIEIPLGNAVAESFFATLKKELIHRRAWPTKAELRTEVFEYIEVFFNRRRRHSTLGMLSPADYEHRTLGHRETSLAASRLAPTHQIRFSAPTPSGDRLIHLSTEAGELQPSLMEYGLWRDNEVWFERFDNV